MIDPAELLTIQQAAQRRGVTRNSIYSLIKRKRLPTIQLGKNIFVKVQDLEALTIQKPGPKPRT